MRRNIRSFIFYCSFFIFAPILIADKSSGPDIILHLICAFFERILYRRRFFVVSCFACGVSCLRLGGKRLARKKGGEAVGKSDIYPRSGYVQKACRGVTVGRKPTVERIV